MVDTNWSKIKTRVSGNFTYKMLYPWQGMLVRYGLVRTDAKVQATVYFAGEE